MHTQHQKKLAIILFTSTLLQSCGYNLMIDGQRQAMRENNYQNQQAQATDLDPFQTQTSPDDDKRQDRGLKHATTGIATALEAPPYTVRAAWRAQQQRRGLSAPQQLQARLPGGADRQEQAEQKEKQSAPDPHQRQQTPRYGRPAPNLQNAIRHFQGQGERDIDLTHYLSWYDNNALEDLARTLENKSSHLLTVVFYDQTPHAQHNSFVEQLKQIKLLRNHTGKKAALFISKEPGPGANHYIFGLLYENNLILINPVGNTTHQAFYDALAQTQTQALVEELYLSNTPIQKEDALVSCGPISAELLLHYGSMTHAALDNTVRAIWASATDSTNNTLTHKTVDVHPYLPQALQELAEAAEDQERYQEHAIKLRKMHLQRLQLADTSWTEERHEQVVFAQLVVEEKAITQVETSEAYRRLIETEQHQHGTDTRTKHADDRHDTNAALNLHNTATGEHNALNVQRQHRTLAHGDSRLDKSNPGETEDKCISLDYWYEEREIERVLEAVLTQHSTQKSMDKKAYNMPGGTTLFMLGPFDNISPSYGLPQALAAHNAQPGIVIIPFNLGRSHWVGLVLQYDQQGRRVRAEYYDSLQGQVPQYLNTILQEQGQRSEAEVTVFTPVTGQQLLTQHNGSDCGPCTIENLLSQTEIGYIPERDPQKRRIRHLNILEQNDYGNFFAPFYDRQRFNQRSFLPNNAYENGSNSTAALTMTPHEQDALKDLCERIRSFPTIAEAIQAIQFEQTEVQPVLQDIRAALETPQEQTTRELNAIKDAFFYRQEGRPLEEAPLKLDFQQLKYVQELLAHPQQLPDRTTGTQTSNPTLLTTSSAQKTLRKKVDPIRFEKAFEQAGLMGETYYHQELWDELRKVNKNFCIRFAKASLYASRNNPEASYNLNSKSMLAFLAQPEVCNPKEKERLKTILTDTVIHSRAALKYPVRDGFSYTQIKVNAALAIRTLDPDLQKKLCENLQKIYRDAENDYSLRTESLIVLRALNAIQQPHNSGQEMRQCCQKAIQDQTENIDAYRALALLCIIEPATENELFQEVVARFQDQQRDQDFRIHIVAEVIPILCKVNPQHVAEVITLLQNSIAVNSEEHNYRLQYAIIPMLTDFCDMDQKHTQTVHAFLVQLLQQNIATDIRQDDDNVEQIIRALESLCARDHALMTSTIPVLVRTVMEYQESDALQEESVIEAAMAGLVALSKHNTDHATRVLQLLTKVTLDRISLRSKIEHYVQLCAYHPHYADHAKTFFLPLLLHRSLQRGEAVQSLYHFVEDYPDQRASIAQWALEHLHNIQDEQGIPEATQALVRKTITLLAQD